MYMSLLIVGQNPTRTKTHADKPHPNKTPNGHNPKPRGQNPRPPWQSPTFDFALLFRCTSDICFNESKEISFQMCSEMPAFVQIIYFTTVLDCCSACYSKHGYWISSSFQFIQHNVHASINAMAMKELRTFTCWGTVGIQNHGVYNYLSLQMYNQ